MALVLPSTARAQLSVRAAGVGGWQYNSNVFDVQSGFPVPGTAPPTFSICGRFALTCNSGVPRGGDHHYSDWYYSYGAQVNLSETYSQQNWFLIGGATHFTYDHFTQLSHSEYLLDGGWNWKLDDIWDGRLEVSRTRTMVAFTEIVQLELAVDIEQRESALVGLQITPEWRAEASGFSRKLSEPLLGEPNLQLTESSASLALKYGGTAGLTSGVLASYSHGSYSGATLFASPAYNEKSVGLTATYKPAAPSTTSTAGPQSASTFDGAVGWSERTSRSGVDDLSGLIGHLDYSNQLTAKTSAKIAVDRAINSYLTNAGSEIDTSIGLSAVWQATYRIGVTPGYTWLYRFLPAQGPTPGSDRGDHMQFASLTIDYEARPWLAIKPYANFQTRRSNLYGGNFNASVYGANVTLALQYP